jgi:uncharacterized protein (DUF2141 family)
MGAGNDGPSTPSSGCAGALVQKKVVRAKNRKKLTIMPDGLHQSHRHINLQVYDQFMMTQNFGIPKL